MEGLISWAQQQMGIHGLWFLFVFSFLESFVQPIPVEPVLIAAVSFHIDTPLNVLLLTFSSSILGACLGYYCGGRYGHPAFLLFFRNKGKKWMATGEHFFEKWGAWTVFLSAFTPIPFKVAAWMSGIFEMPFHKFLIAACAGRFLRFGVVVYGLDFFLR